MKQKTLGLLTIFILCLSIISGCAKDDDKSDDDSTTDYVPAKGFAESDEEPEGTALVLPDGLNFEGIEPYYILDETDCNGEPRVGAPAEGYVPLCLLFRNTLQHPITLQLPPGLIFISKETKIQNGILVQKISKEIPAQQYLYVPIRAQCINPGRFIPGVGNVYRMGPVTQNGPMLDLIKKLATKNLAATGDINIDADIEAKIQRLVFNVARNGKMNDFDKSLLDQLPNL
ncbi:hypothetical protein GA0116948_1031 [Chitinophaga costaii]|uniref:Lipoprotein n=1 Tax=Chitinophaga costaii TaxID=1335309 RepID=A0A1C4B9K5_9BACT|nr:hypothetical protein [Chitinophaga costaii]PUZ27696.1 hypothetical protein DCM91_05635 [Chitinophaga costaii]SCC03533.1 hypothetical protein GA0116948_1031 [Chitinophaga costaii]